MIRLLPFLLGWAVTALAPALPATPGATLLWLAWIAVPGLSWAPSGRAFADPARWLVPGLLHLLTVTVFWNLAGFGASSLPWALAVSWILPLGLRWRRSASPPGAARLDGRLLAVCVLSLAVWMLLRPAPVGLYSDAPGHLATIRVAIEQDSLQPIDPSAGAPEATHDPRFGVLHGLYAAISMHGGWDPESIVRAAPILFAGLWLIAHASFFAIFLAGRRLPLLIALLFTLAGADARLYGLWSVAYPGNFALAAGTLALAECWRARRWAWRPHAAELLLAATVFVHPFAWWGGCVVLLHAALWRVLQTRSLRRASLALALRCLVLGAIASLPLLFARAGSVAGPHGFPIDVVMLGDSGLYFCDPFRVMRWSGALAPWLLPLLLLGAGRMLREPRGALLIAAPLALWTVAFDPLVQPWLYPLVGYLSERIGRLGYAELVACVLIARPWTERYEPRRRGGRSWRFAGALIGILMLLRAVSWGERVLRADPSKFAGPDIHVLDEVVDALEEWPQATLLADPRSSYAIAARRGGDYVLMPVAHTSPNDRGIEQRLMLYRSLLDPFVDGEQFAATLDSLKADLLLVHTDLAEWAEPEEFGFVADDLRQRQLWTRLADAGNEAVASGKDWALFACEGLRAGPPRQGEDCLLLSEPPPIARGSAFEVVAIQPLQRRVAPGGTLQLELIYRVRSDGVALPPSQIERVHLRLEGDMPQLPEWVRFAGKPIRKLLIERSGASERRFGMAFVPFGGYRAPESWSTDFACERVELRVPPRIPEGSYGIQVTVHASTWRPRHRLSDFLSDRDRFSAEAVAYVEIVEDPIAPVSAEDGTR